MQMREMIRLVEAQRPTKTFTVLGGDQRETVTAQQTSSGKWMYYDTNDEPWLIDGTRLIHKTSEGWVETGTSMTM